jgi:hypothetical protein
MHPTVRVERWAFVALTLLVQAYVFLRALDVPLVHDEATSFIAYAQPGTFLPFASMWDANNHFLNSLCGHLGFRLFGLHPLALRWASVLSYALYAWCVWRMGARIERNFIRWMLWLAMLACPFLLDFFSLFRGYGPAMALILLAVHHAMGFLETGSTRRLASSLLSMSAALGFMLGLLPAAMVLLAVLLARAWRERGQLTAWLALGLAPLIACALLAWHMGRLGLLYQGTTEGYVITTIGSLLRFAFGAEGAAWRVAIVLFAALVTAGLALSRRRARLPQGIVVVGALLWGEWALRWLLASTVGLNYAEDRTALHVLVLFIVFVALAADALQRKHAVAWLLALPLLAFPLRSAITANLDRTALWPEQSIPARFIARIEALEQELGRPSVVGMHRLAGLPYGLQRRLRFGEGDGTSTLWPNTPADARLEVKGVPFDADPRYALADSAANGLMLYLRAEPWQGRPIIDTLFEVQSVGLERSRGLPIPIEHVRDGDVLALAHGALRGPDALDLRVCVAVFDSAGHVLHGDHVVLATRRAVWSGEPWRTALVIPRLPDAARAELFFWEPQRKAFTVEHGRLRALAME